MGVPTPFLAVIGASAGYGQVYRTQKHRKPLAGTPSHARRARYQAVAPNRSDLGLRPAPPRRPTCGKRRLRALAVGATRPARLPSSVVLTRNARRLTYYEDRAACCLRINSCVLMYVSFRPPRDSGLRPESEPCPAHASRHMISLYKGTPRDRHSRPLPLHSHFHHTPHSHTSALLRAARRTAWAGGPLAVESRVRATPQNAHA